MFRAIGVTMAMLLAAATARATPYWIDWEGDDWPENQGWLRVWGDENGPYGGAERSLENGILTLDGLRNDQIYDFYEIQRSIDPGPGETFLAEWRVLVDSRSDPTDVGIVIARDDPPGHVFLDLGPSRLWLPDDGVGFDLEPNVFHAFSFYSADMQEYELVVDGTVEYESSFNSQSILDSFVNFGDGVQGQRSYSRWDYFRFGAVPEPAAIWSLGLVACCVRRRG